ncbi:hypothetical protein ACA910_020192 [Epithemia clementina (nom. ined.)]
MTLPAHPPRSVSIHGKLDFSSLLLLPIPTEGGRAAAATAATAAGRSNSHTVLGSDVWASSTTAATATDRTSTCNKSFSLLIQNKKSTPRPKNPLSAYNLYFQVERRRILDGTDGLGRTPITSQEILEASITHKKLQQQGTKRIHRKSHGKISFGELARTIANRWKVLDSDTRVLLEHQALLEKQEHVQLVEIWEQDQQQEQQQQQGQQQRSLSSSTTANLRGSIAGGEQEQQLQEHQDRFFQVEVPTASPLASSLFLLNGREEPQVSFSVTPSVTRNTMVSPPSSNHHVGSQDASPCSSCEGQESSPTTATMATNYYHYPMNKQQSRMEHHQQLAHLLGRLPPQPFFLSSHDSALTGSSPHSSSRPMSNSSSSEGDEDACFITDEEAPEHPHQHHQDGEQGRPCHALLFSLDQPQQSCLETQADDERTPAAAVSSKEASTWPLWLCDLLSTTGGLTPGATGLAPMTMASTNTTTTTGANIQNGGNRSTTSRKGVVGALESNLHHHHHHDANVLTWHHHHHPTSIRSRSILVVGASDQHYSAAATTTTEAAVDLFALIDPDEMDDIFNEDED